MNLTGTRRAEEFHRLVESSVRDDDPVSGPLLAVVDALRSTPTVPAPRPEFRAALRQRLVAVATVQGVGETESPMRRARSAGSTWKVQRRLTALAAGAAVVTGVAGVGVGSSRSLPGQPLYGVKRAAEAAQLAATVGTEARGKRHLEFARTRLAEIKALAGSSSSLGPIAGDNDAAAGSSAHAQLIQQTLRAMDEETRSGANDLFAAFQSSGSREPLLALNDFSREQYADLRGLLPELPEPSRPAAGSSLALLQVVAQWTVRYAGSAPSPTSTTPSVPAPGPSSSTTSNSPSATPAVKPSSGGSTPTRSSSPTGSGGTPILPTNNSTVLPIPPLPTLTPVPTQLPTELPTLPDVGGLLGH